MGDILLSTKTFVRRINYGCPSIPGKITQSAEITQQTRPPLFRLRNPEHSDVRSVVYADDPFISTPKNLVKITHKLQRSLSHPIDGNFFQPVFVIGSSIEKIDRDFHMSAVALLRSMFLGTLPRYNIYCRSIN